MYRKHPNIETVATNYPSFKSDIVHISTFNGKTEHSMLDVGIQKALHPSGQTEWVLSFSTAFEPEKMSYGGNDERI